jgi:glycosyltransferase involved in cell wall biosynthesis
MNILYLCDEYPPCQHGGIGTVTQILAREIRRKGHQMIVCGFYPYYRSSQAIEDDSGVIVFRRFYGNKLTLKLSRNKFLGMFFNIEKEFKLYIKFLKELIKDYKIDIIEMPDFNEVFRYTGPRFVNFPDFGIPTVVKLHGTYSFVNHTVTKLPINNSIYKKEKYLIHNATKVVAVSKFSKNEAQKIFDYQKEIYVIYNGISVEKQVNYMGGPDTGTIIYAGTLAEQKGVLSLIKAWEKVVKKFPLAKLLLYGKGDSNTIEKLVNNIPENISGSVEIKGFIQRSLLPEIYKSASCAIFPSYVESFSMAPMESMLAGCPTIYTKRASGEELITNGINGLLIDPDNLQEIADAINALLGDRTLAKKIGKNGTATIRSRFCMSNIAEEHLAFYSGLI